jgi:hypothetical protein
MFRRALAFFSFLLIAPIAVKAAENVIIVDDGDSSFSKQGTWQPTQILIPGAAYNSDYLQAGPSTPPAKADWTIFVNPGVDGPACR